MQRNYHSIKKYVIIVFVLFLIFGFPNKSLAQQGKVQLEEKKDKQEEMRKQVDLLIEQQKKVYQLWTDTLGISKVTSEQQEYQILLRLLDTINEAHLRLEIPGRVMYMYSLTPKGCEPNPIMDDFVKKSLEQKKAYENMIDKLNVFLSLSNKPSVVLQYDKAKQEIRNCIEVLEKAKDFFK